MATVRVKPNPITGTTPSTPSVLDIAALMGPLGIAADLAPYLKSLGKPISELLDAAFTTPTKSGLPSRLTLTGWNAKTGEVGLHGARQGAERFAASPGQLDTLIEGGTVGLKQPPQGAVDSIRAKLAALLGTR